MNTVRSLLAVAGLGLVASAAHADLRLLDDGTRTRQVEADRDTLYILKDSGEVWSHRFGDFERIDDGRNSRQLAAADGHLFLLKETGTVFRHEGRGRWTPIDDGTNTRMITTSRGKLYLLKDSGNIFRFDGRRWGLLDGGTGTKQIEARDGQLWILKDSGNVWRYHEFGNRFEKVDGGTNTRCIAATESGVAILKDSGELWSFRRGDFQRVDHDPDLRDLAADGDVLYTRTRWGRVTRHDLRWGDRQQVRTPPDEPVKAIEAARGTLYLLQQSGNIFTWTSSPWAPVAASGAAFEEIYGSD